MALPTPVLTAQSVPPTAAQPPRMPLVFVLVVVIVPVAVGSVKLTVPPTLRVIAPSAVTPVLAVATTADNPLLRVVPLKLTPVVRLLTVKVPPLSTRLLPDKMLPATPVPNVSPPALTVVTPVYVLAPAKVRVPPPNFVRLPPVPLS